MGRGFRPPKFLPVGWIEHQNVGLVAQGRKTDGQSLAEFAG